MLAPLACKCRGQDAPGPVPLAPRPCYAGCMTPLRYPQPRRLLWGARIVAVASLLLAGLALVAGFGLMTAEGGKPGNATPATMGPALETAVLALVGAFSAAVLAYAIVGFPLRCAACGHRILAEMTGPKAPSGRMVSGLNAWAATVADILRHRRFRCPACGAEQVLDDPKW